jgi:hypothetical protein
VSVPEWLGDVPTWIGASGAIGAAWFAYQTITSQRQQIGEQQAFIAEQIRFMAEQQQNLELERAELRAAAEDRKWAQARRVDMAAVKVPLTAHGAPTTQWAVTVTNYSTAPVTGLEVRFGTAYVAAEVYEWDRSSAAATNGRQRGRRLILPVPLLGPGRAVRFVSQEWRPETARDNQPTLTFTDDDGVRWSLDSYGKLEEAPADGG